MRTRAGSGVWLLVVAVVLGPGPARAGDGAPPPGGSATAADGQEGIFRNWDAEVYRWGGKDVVQGFVAGGIFTGLLIGGAIGRADRRAYHVFEYGFDSPVPPFGVDDHGPKEVVPAYVADYLYLTGVQGTVPVWGSLIPTLIVAGTGADLQRVKTVGSYAAGASMIVTGVFQLSRFSREYRAQIEVFTADDSNGDRFWFVPPGVGTLAAGIADVAIGAVCVVGGSLQAAGVVRATPKEGLLGRVGTPFMVPTEGGAALGLAGTF